MLKKIIPLHKFNYRTYITQTEFIDKIQNFTMYNLKYVDSFELKINNPKKLNIFNNFIYEGSLWFSKNNMRINKRFENNDVNFLFDEISLFINKEIKL